VKVWGGQALILDMILYSLKFPAYRQAVGAARLPVGRKPSGAPNLAGIFLKWNPQGGSFKGD